MNKIFILVGLVFTSLFSFSQCTPLVQYADSTFGIWPDTVDNLPHAAINTPYETTLHLKAPNSIEDLDIVLPIAVGINSLEIEDITGMPAGFTYACDNNDCSWGSGDHGCFTISGTPTQLGTYTLDIKTRGHATVPFVGDTVYTFSGYQFVVDETLGYQLKSASFFVEQNYPNPFHFGTQIKYHTTKAQRVVLEVYNLLGEVVYSAIQDAGVGAQVFNLNLELNAGNYFYNITTPDDSKVMKMTVVTP